MNHNSMSPKTENRLAAAAADASIGVQRGEAVAAARKRASLWHLSRIVHKEFGQKLLASIRKDDLTGRAAQLAYYFFFALFPALIAASSVMGMVIRSTNDLNDQLLGYMANVIPPSAFAIVAETFKQTAHASNGGKVVLGTLVALWTASSGTAAVQDALNAIHNVQESRPFWRARLTAILLTIAVGILFVVALGVLFLGDRLVRNEHTGFGFVVVVAVRLVTWPVAFAIMALAFGLVYWKAPDIDGKRWRWITPGAAIGILLWLLASLALRLYLHYFNSYSVTYGSLGAVIVLLTWFYISGLALLLGSVINDTLESVSDELSDSASQTAR